MLESILPPPCECRADFTPCPPCSNCNAPLTPLSLSCFTSYSAGKSRELGRRVDYWMIALSSAMLTRALFPDLPPVVTAASLASTPFKPFLVTTGNALALEGKFLQRSLQNPGVFFCAASPFEILPF